MNPDLFSRKIMANVVQILSNGHIFDIIHFIVLIKGGIL